VPNQTAADVLEEWGDTLRLERHRRRLNQAKVAELSGLSTRTVSNVESGRGSLDAFLAIAHALEIKLLESA
jgi:transcriptional regulator with XRE-family HTH domain